MSCFGKNGNPLIGSVKQYILLSCLNMIKIRQRSKKRFTFFKKMCIIPKIGVKNYENLGKIDDGRAH